MLDDAEDRTDQWRTGTPSCGPCSPTGSPSTLDDEAATLAAFEAHYAAVRATVPADRLLEWTVADGWGPLCAALDVPVPDDPFPRLNTRDDWAPPEDPDEFSDK